MAQVSLYTDPIWKMHRLLDLESDDLARVVSSEDVFSLILNFFHHKEAFKLGRRLEGHGKYTKERMEDLIKRLEDRREELIIWIS